MDLCKDRIDKNPDLRTMLKSSQLYNCKNLLFHHLHAQALLQSVFYNILQLCRFCHC